MKEHRIMIRKFARYFALILAVAIVLGILFRGRLSTWLQGDEAFAAKAAQQKSAGNDMANMPGMGVSEGKPAEVRTAQSAPQGERKVLYYYDAMNPTFRSDKPGLAADGMQLVPKYADEDAGMENMPVGTVKIAEGKQQLIGVQTATVQRERLFRTIRAVGQLTADETKLAHIHLKVNGWIDQVYVDYIGQLVKKGQPLFTLYSPDLVATEHEYLIARRGKQYLGNSSFPEASQGSS